MRQGVPAKVLPVPAAEAIRAAVAATREGHLAVAATIAVTVARTVAATKVGVRKVAIIAVAVNVPRNAP
jgi:hypothetical protein